MTQGESPGWFPPLLNEQHRGEGATFVPLHAVRGRRIIPRHRSLGDLVWATRKTANFRGCSPRKSASPLSSRPRPPRRESIHHRLFRGRQSRLVAATIPSNCCSAAAINCRRSRARPSAGSGLRHTTSRSHAQPGWAISSGPRSSQSEIGNAPSMPLRWAASGSAASARW